MRTASPMPAVIHRLEYASVPFSLSERNVEGERKQDAASVAVREKISIQRRMQKIQEVN
jgi:hypothetical protein